MRRTRGTVQLLVVIVMSSVVPIATAQIGHAQTQMLTVTPRTDLTVGQTVAVAGEGLPPDTDLFVRQCEAPDPVLCSSPVSVTTDAGGHFSSSYVLVSCRPDQACLMTLFTSLDIEVNAIAVVQLFLRPPPPPGPQPDGFIKAVGGTATLGDNVYNTSGAGQTRTRTIEPNGQWSFPLRLQNDGPDDVDDITVTAPPSTAPFVVRYFVGYYDVTSYVTGGGFTFLDMAPGEIQNLAVQFRASTGAPSGSSTARLVTFTSANAPQARDAVSVGVLVQSTTN